MGSYDGLLPKLNRSYEGVFDKLVAEFQGILTHLLQAGAGSEQAPMLVFFCKAGRHRSYALLIAFLMWSAHVHDPSVWTALIAPVRAQTLRKGQPVQCELRRAEQMGNLRMGKGTVPFGDVLLKFANYLNSHKELHRWSMPVAL